MMTLDVEEVGLRVVVVVVVGVAVVVGGARELIRISSSVGSSKGITLDATPTISVEGKCLIVIPVGHWKLEDQ